MENNKIYIPDSVKDSPSEIEKQFIQMRSSGLSINSIARQLKKSTHTISDWNKKYADIILVGRNAEFCELQKKVIEFILLRLNFLKSEVNRISEILSKIDVGGTNEEYEYEELFEWFIKLCI
jgi:transposase